MGFFFFSLSSCETISRFFHFSPPVTSTMSLQRAKLHSITLHEEQ
jgi:hypothetical protein